MSSPLDRIEAKEPRGFANLGGWFVLLTIGERDALVNVAKAAEGTGWRDADGLCWCEKSTEITRSQHRPQCLRMREALAALNKEPA